MNLRLLRNIVLPAIAVVGLLSAPVAEAQILYVTNLEESTLAGIAVGSERMLAQAFQTGTSDQYSLDTVTLALSTAGSPTNLTVSIYSDNAGLPGTNLGTLSGTPAAGEVPFEASNLTLNGSTQYWIILSSTNSFSGGSFYAMDLTTSTSYTAQDGWTIAPGKGYESIDAGGSWSQLSSVSGAFQFSIDAVAIPEPAPLALGGVAAVAFAILRRRKS